MQQTRSCAFRTCLAISGEETTRVGTRPSFKCITGPYLCDSSRKHRCGRIPSWCKLPMIGSWGGPGGRFDGFLNILMENKMGIREQRSRRMREVGGRKSTSVLVMAM